MANDVKAAGLEPITEEDVLELAREVIGEHHKDLADAEIRWFWMLNKEATTWGATKATTEREWWLSATDASGATSGRDPVDIVITLNSALWGNLGRNGRMFVLDHRLSLVKLKEGGQTEMSTKVGTRYLYEAVKHSLGVSPEVIARNAQGFVEIKELKKLAQAIGDPSQFLLDLRAAEDAADAGDEDDQEGGPGGGASDQPEPDPIYYYNTYRLETGLRAGWLVFLQYDAAEKTPHHLTGVHFPENQHPAGGDDPVDKSTLPFDQSVSAVRNDLLADLEARRVAALEDSEGDGLDREVEDEPGSDSEEEIIDQTIDDAIEAGEIEVPAIEADEEGDAVGNVTPSTTGNVTPFTRAAAR